MSYIFSSFILFTLSYEISIGIVSISIGLILPFLVGGFKSTLFL